MTDSHLSFNKDVTPDSSSLDLRQHGDVWRSNVWVLHSSRPCALPSQHSQDSRQCCASWSEGVRTRPDALRLTVQQWQSENPHSTLMTLQQALRRGGRCTKAPFSLCWHKRLMQASRPQTNHWNWFGWLCGSQMVLRPMALTHPFIVWFQGTN